MNRCICMAGILNPNCRSDHFDYRNEIVTHLASASGLGSELNRHTDIGEAYLELAGWIESPDSEIRTRQILVIANMIRNRIDAAERSAQRGLEKAA